MHLKTLMLCASSALALHHRHAEDVYPESSGYIIEYSHDAASRRQQLQSMPGIEVVRTFESRVFTGLSVKTSQHTAEELRNLPGVVGIWPNGYAYPAPIETVEVARQDFQANWTTHASTGVDKLHNLGIYGKGVKIGVVDSGIYYNHPALGGGFGPGFKVEGGWDLVGDNEFPEGPREPDDDPIDIGGHGTHVSGLLAGQNEHWQGVAPEATLYSYKVFNGESASTYDVIIEAFLQAYEDGMDIITASIIGNSGWSEHPWAVVASRLVEEGVVVTIAAGNAGTLGPFWGDSVASVDADSYPLVPFSTTLTLDGVSNDTINGYTRGTNYFPPSVRDWPVLALDLNSSIVGEACQALPESTPDLGDVVTLVRRGGCSYTIKQTNLEAAGAQFIIFYNDVTELLAPTTSSNQSTLALVTAETGHAMIEALSRGVNVTVDFSLNPEAVIGVEYQTAGKPSYFSSWGALWDLHLKPDIAAPGGNIYSTWINGLFTVQSGTSMACPYVAGVAALWISVHGGRETHGKGFAKMLHQRIASSGISLPWAGYPDPSAEPTTLMAPPAQVGTGLIDAWKVLQYSTRLEFESMALNETKYFQSAHNVTIFNEGSEDVVYTLSVEHGAGIEAVGWFRRPATGVYSKRLKTLIEVDPIPLEVGVKVPCPIVIPAGESATVTVRFENPEAQGWNASALPTYGGKVLLRGSNGEQLAVPFFGVASDLRRELDPVTVPGFPTIVSGPGNIPIANDSSFSFDLSLEQQGYPRLTNNLIWGTREVRWDIFESGWSESRWTYPPTVGEDGYIGSATSWTRSVYQAPFDPAVDDAEDVVPFPMVDLTRNAPTNAGTGYFWLGGLANGTQIGSGSYMMRIASLKPWGDPTVSDDWEVYMSEMEVRRNIG
ncbi:peptidase S8/S53 domain-containing protein [Stachybotrys elegans]|uniref:Peptidase S8/S53 domain-containing protein n=1 Tax=Stachybotrys elegans TaxID=80388 RepID=A0A8K0WXC9_9HYPO|nr:peptidase S8/S53 domain-containing protein [Stachybotrys elegans]